MCDPRAQVHGEKTELALFGMISRIHWGWFIFRLSEYFSTIGGYTHSIKIEMVTLVVLILTYCGVLVCRVCQATTGDKCFTLHQCYVDVVRVGIRWVTRAQVLVQTMFCLYRKLLVLHHSVVDLDFCSSEATLTRVSASDCPHAYVC